MDKPGSWFLLAKFSCIFTENVTLPRVLFKHFASKTQLSGFYINEILVLNGLTLPVQFFTDLLCEVC